MNSVCCPRIPTSLWSHRLCLSKAELGWRSSRSPAAAIRRRGFLRLQRIHGHISPLPSDNRGELRNARMARVPSVAGACEQQGWPGRSRCAAALARLASAVACSTAPSV